MGTYYGQPYNDSNTVGVRMSWDIKGDTYGSTSRSDPTFWSRNIGECEEQPLIAKREAYDRDGYKYLDVTDQFYMSRSIGDPLGFSNSARLAARAANLASEMDTKLLLKLAAKRDGARAQLGASLGEARTTLDMLANATLRPARALLFLKKGQFRAAASEIGINRANRKPGQTAANFWLQYQYGWKPLYSDVKFLYDRFGEQAAKPMFIHAKVSKEITEEFHDHTKDWYESARATVGVTARYVPTAFSELDAQGLLNPLSIAWELVPFSFVVDWFVPVGNVLQAITATADLEFISGFRSSKIQSDLTNYNNGSPDQQVLQRGSHRTKSTRFIRNPFYSFPLPSLYADETPFSSTRVANASALLTQLFTGRY
jgi:hypothetical protein